MFYLIHLTGLLINTSTRRFNIYHQCSYSKYYLVLEGQKTNQQNFLL